MLCIGSLLHKNEIPPDCRSFAAFYDHLYVGTNDAQVVMLTPNKVPEHLSLTNRAGKPVLELVILGEIGILAALCGGAVEIIDMQRMVLKSSKFPVKGEVLGIAVNQERVPDFALCVATSHKIHILRWVNDRYELWKSLNIPSAPIGLGWSRNNICVALQEEVIMVDLALNTHKQIHEHVSPSEPKAKIVALPGSYFVLCLGNLGVLIGPDGQPTGGTLIWKTTPTIVVCTGDFVVSLHRSGKQLEVRRLTGNLIDSLILEDSVVCIFAPAPWNALPPDENPSLEHLAAGGGVLLLTRNQVMGLGTVTLKDKLRQMWTEEDMDGAWYLYLSRVIRPFEADRKMLGDMLVDGFTSKEQLTNKYHADAAVVMLELGRLSIAFQEFAKSNADPRDIIFYFENVQPHGLEYTPVLIRPPILLRIKSKPIEESEHLLQRCSMWRILPPKLDCSLDRELITMLVKYLLASRVHSGMNADDVLDILDGTILNSYLLLGTNESHFQAAKCNAEAFLSDKTFIVDREKWGRILESKGFYHAAALLYSESSGLKRQALQLWSDIGSNKYKDGERNGIDETVEFLSHHYEDQELVFLFSSWVLRKQPAKGILIFTNSNNLLSLNPERVLGHLDSFDPNKRFKFILQYLETLSYLTRDFDIQLGVEFVDCLEKQFGEILYSRFKSFVGREETLISKSEEENGVSTAVINRIDQSSVCEKLLHEKAALLRKCSWHSQALDILVVQLDDHVAAEEYCASEPSAFHDLLHIYFNPSVPAAKRDAYRSASMNLLEKYGSVLDPSQVVSRLPADFLIHDLVGYLTSVFSNRVGSCNSIRIHKNLAVANNIKIRDEQMSLHALNVSVTQDTRCNKCKNPLQSSAFALDTTHKYVVHLSCQKQ